MRRTLSWQPPRSITKHWRRLRAANPPVKDLDDRHTALMTPPIWQVNESVLSCAAFKPRHAIERPTMVRKVLYASRPHIGEPRIIFLTEIHHMSTVMTELIDICIENLDLACAAEMSQCQAPPNAVQKLVRGPTRPRKRAPQNFA